MKTSLLMYDVPTTSEMDNPSNLLRRVALRINLSVWVVDSDRTPWTLLNEMTTAGVTWHLFPFAEEATENVLKVAADMLRKDLADIAKRENESLVRADAQLAETLADTTAGDKTFDAARTKHSKHRESTLKRTEKVVADLEVAAEMFGLDLGSFNFKSAHSRVTAIRSLNGARAASYAELAQTAKGTAMEVAAKAGEVPTGVLQDYLEDRGVDVSASRAAFSTPVSLELNPVVSSTNGKAKEEQKQAERTFSVATRRGVRSVKSTFSDTAAAAICFAMRDNRFAREISSRFRRGAQISANQLAWIHVLAVESLPKPTAVVESKPAPTQKIIEDAKTIVKGWNDQGRTRGDIANEFKEVLTGQTPRPSTADDLLPHEQPSANVPEISTEKMTCSGGICRVAASTVNLNFFPATIHVKSHRTGQVLTFSKHREHMQGDELLSVEYHSGSHILNITND